MNKYIKFISPIVFIISLILILILKTIPSGKLWKNYSVLCVPVNTNDSLVLSAADEAGISGLVSLSGQYLPISLTENSIEISMLRLNYNSPAFSYLNKRNAMFFDKSQSYRLYYIPSKYNSETSALMRILKSKGIDCQKDSSAEYPWLLPLMGILLAGMLMLFSKHKLPFVAGAIIPLVFLYGNPFYPVATATCLSLLILFFISNLWRRKGAVSILLNKIICPAMLVIALLSAFSCSILSGFLFILAICGTAAALKSYRLAEDFYRNRKVFVPVYIRSAKRVSLFAGKVFTSMNIVTGAVAIFIILIFVTSTDSIKNSSVKLLFPASTSVNDNKLPQFEEYYKWNWNVKTYPYKSLNNTYSDDEVEFSSFIEDEKTGIISEKITTIKYDNSFKQKVYEDIDQLQFDSVEKVMKSESENFCGGYTAASSYQINIFGIIMCFICLFILLFIYFSIIIRKGINK